MKRAIEIVWVEVKDIAGGSDLSMGEHFFVKYRGPSGGSQMSGGGIIILRG